MFTLIVLNGPAAGQSEVQVDGKSLGELYPGASITVNGFVKESEYRPIEGDIVFLHTSKDQTNGL